MKMLSTPTVASITDYPAYVYNCLRNAACEPSWAAPLPSVPHLELYVEYGSTKPNTVEFWLRDVCNDASEQIFPANYVVGKTPEGVWYGVYKYFNTPMDPVTTFVVWHSALVEVGLGTVEKTYFSQMLIVPPCGPLTKVKSCHPEGATDTGFDVNGVYYGLPTNVDYLGLPTIRYFHIAWVRLGKLREMSNKAVFKSSLVANFRTTIEKLYQFETELVPKWFKDVLLAIYSRGAVSFDNGPAKLVSDLAFEAINDDDLTWKPFAQLKDTFRLYFGCDESVCVECCSPEVLGAETFSEDSPSGSESTSESEPPAPQQFLGVIQSNSGGSGNVINSVKFNGNNVTHQAGDNLPIGFNDTGTFRTPSALPGTFNVTVNVSIGVSPPVGGVTVTGSNGVAQNQATPVSGNYIFPLVQADDTDLWLVQMGTFL